MLKLDDMNYFQYQTYMNNKIRDRERSIINRQFENEELAKQALEGTLDEDDSYLDNNISAIEKFLRSNTSYLRQFKKYCRGENRPRGLQDGIYNTFLSNLSKTLYQFGIMDDNFDELLDEIDYSSFDTTKFNNMNKLYNKFLSSYRIFNNFFMPVDDDVSNFNRLFPELQANGNNEEVSQMRRLNEYLYNVNEESLKVIENMNRLKENIQLKSSIKGKIGAGEKMPVRYL